MKPNSLTPLIAAGAIVLVVVTATFVLRGRDGPSAPAAGASAAIEAVDAAAAGQAPPSARQPPSDRLQGTPVVHPQDHVARRAEMRRQHEERTARLREESIQRYASEQVDAQWAPQKEGELNTVADNPLFEEAGAKPTSLSIDCRTSMCRIDGQFADRGNAEDWILMYMASVGKAMPNSVVSRRVNPDGSIRVEIYGRAR